MHLLSLQGNKMFLQLSLVGVLCTTKVTGRFTNLSPIWYGNRILKDEELLTFNVVREL